MVNRGNFTRTRTTLTEETACSFIDPFCLAARSARFPDQAGSLTVPFYFHDKIPVTTGANGQGSVIIAPTNSAYMIGLDPGTTTGRVTTPATWTGGSGTTPGAGAIALAGLVAANAGTIRYNSIGSVYRTTENSTATKGDIIYLETPRLGPVQEVFLDFTAPIYEVDANQPGCQYAAICGTYDAEIAHEFVPLSGANNNNTLASGFHSQIWTVTGATPSTVIGHVEVMVTGEIILRNGSTVVGIQSQVPVTKNPNLVEVVDRAASQFKNFVKGGVEELGQAVRAQVRKTLVEVRDGNVEELITALANVSVKMP
jgi:hypothetical protein